ncbi:hypothetical protein [Pseudomonas tussilaginis]|uniref:hypothetical protein n=1 Tax=Pseudomonas putida TaxID=303 RepID=UPI0023635271|nr:hypothetical protein [Pseudomonas putida]MDD1975302.1 hypothetical protein [Pseudomonas putida]
MATAKKSNTQASTAVVFRDTHYTSRVLILPDARSLLVSRGQVTAQADDAIALAYLQEHPQLKPQE